MSREYAYFPSITQEAVQVREGLHPKYHLPGKGIWGVPRNMEELNTERSAGNGKKAHMTSPVRDGIFRRGDVNEFAKRMSWKVL